MLDWGTLISAALNKIEQASTHSLPGLLQGSCAPLHCYCRKEGTFVTPTLIVQKTFSYIKAKKFHWPCSWNGADVQEKTRKGIIFFWKASITQAIQPYHATLLYLTQMTCRASFAICLSLHRDVFMGENLEED